MTAGIISGLHRQIPGSASSSQSLVELIQPDAAICPGNSGGPVVNGQGEIIRIGEAYIPPQAGAVSLGFAIPATSTPATPSTSNSRGEPTGSRPGSNWRSGRPRAGELSRVTRPG
ncbi:trypsin-like serine protease [Arthrobacter zhaoguopingii]|uniref:trypsin-like serine protease n=1 Tax=Arthrobacter zhaoguopingii TaxID=2681491 RepID=UPI001FE61E81|nr:trypsin-like serine protease [Arthrobacter zhaoguopingii]